MAQTNPIKYVALGDSYTIGTGASVEESWPVLITNQLQKENISIKLIANLGQNGWTSYDVITNQLPICQKLKPDFVTLLIGANDIAQGVSEQTFRNRIKILMEEILKFVPVNAFLIVTIPDFSLTPYGLEQPNLAQAIARFNEIIKEEAKDRGIIISDLYPASQNISKDSSTTSEDGLHPSAKGYALWAESILPGAEQLLKPLRTP